MSHPLQRVRDPCLVLLGRPSRFLDEQQVDLGAGDGPHAVALNGGSLRILLRQPGGGFNVGAALATGGAQPRAIATGDFDECLSQVSLDSLHLPGNATHGFMDFMLMMGVAGENIVADHVDTLDLFHTMEAYFTWYPEGAEA